MNQVVVPSPVVQNQQQDNKRKRGKITVKRTGCNARARVKYDRKNDFYRIEDHVIEHNHAMIPNELNHLKRSARSMTDEKLIAITQFEKCHIKPTDSYNMMVAQAGGEELLGHTKKDHINIVGRIRAESIEQGDAQTLVNKMMVKKKIQNLHYCFICYFIVLRLFVLLLTLCVVVLCTFRHKKMKIQNFTTATNMVKMLDYNAYSGGMV